MTDWLAWIALALAFVPASHLLSNLWLFRAAPLRQRVDGSAPPRVSVLIPARDEEAAIGACLEAVLANRGVELEVVVVDDQSSDCTAEIVRQAAARDPRVRLVAAPPLAVGWCGKQHACHTAAAAARHPLLLFLDADVRLEPDAIERMVSFRERSAAALVSGFPRQLTGTWMEKLVVPLIHFVLLGFLPLVGMRRSQRPAFAAGCGQLFLTTREDYDRVGGHASIRDSRHDGITLPRAYRRAGLATDLCDAAPFAVCRMYRGSRDVWRGFAKNATEGMAAATAILPWTLLLFGGQVLPFLLVASGTANAAAWWAAGLALGSRLVLTLRLRQSWLGFVLHPVGVVIVLAIQWYALWLEVCGARVAWKGRVEVGG